MLHSKILQTASAWLALRFVTIQGVMLMHKHYANNKERKKEKKQHNASTMQ